MNFEHLHLLLNHFPIIGTMVGLGLLLASFFEKNRDLRRGSLIVIAAMALVALPTFFSGFAAADHLHTLNMPGVSQALVARHEGSAMLSIWFMEIAGSLALIGLLLSREMSGPPAWNVSAVLIFTLLTMGLMARTGNTGGDIRHPEDRPAGQVVDANGIGAFLYHFEPNPQGFTDAMTYNKWISWYLMAPHFLGLALIIGTVGILDLRIMGFMKQLPSAPFHKFIPWALAGLAVNVLTGTLAFIGQWYIYIYSYPFWLKMLSLLLLGLNASAFYMTGVFPGVENLQAGEDAPISAKLVAFSSLLLWFLVITFGRYIQPLSGSIHPN